MRKVIPSKPYRYSDDASPLQVLRHHVSGAIERGEKAAIIELPAPAAPVFGRRKPKSA